MMVAASPVPGNQAGEAVRVHVAAVHSSGKEYSILAGLVSCGTLAVPAHLFPPPATNGAIVDSSISIPRLTSSSTGSQIASFSFFPDGGQGIVAGGATAATQERVRVPASIVVDAIFLPYNKMRETQGDPAMGMAGSETLTSFVLESLAHLSNPTPSFTPMARVIQLRGTLDKSSFARVPFPTGPTPLPTNTTSYQAGTTVINPTFIAAIASSIGSDPPFADGGEVEQRDVSAREDGLVYGLGVTGALTSAFIVYLLFHAKTRKRVFAFVKRRWAGMKTVWNGAIEVSWKMPGPSAASAADEPAVAMADLSVGSEGVVSAAAVTSPPAAQGANRPAAAVMDEPSIARTEMAMDRMVAPVATIASADQPSAHDTVTCDNCVSGMISDGSANRPIDNTEVDMRENAPLVAGMMCNSTGHEAGIAVDAGGHGVVETAISGVGQVVTLHAVESNEPPLPGIVRHGSPTRTRPGHQTTINNRGIVVMNFH